MKNKKKDRKKRLAKRKAQAEKRKAKNEAAQASLVVKTEQKKVNLYCPTCVETAKKVIEEKENASQIME